MNKMKIFRVLLLVLFVLYISPLSAQVISMDSYGKRVYDGTDWKSNFKYYQTTSILNLREKQKVWEIYTGGKKYIYTIKETTYHQKGRTINAGKVCSYVCVGENGARYNIDFSYMSDITGVELFTLTIVSPWRQVIYYILGDEFWKNNR